MARSSRFDLSYGFQDILNGQFSPTLPYTMISQIIERLYTWKNNMVQMMTLGTIAYVAKFSVSPPTAPRSQLLDIFVHHFSQIVGIFVANNFTEHSKPPRPLHRGEKDFQKWINYIFRLYCNLNDIYRYSSIYPFALNSLQLWNVLSPSLGWILYQSKVGMIIKIMTINRLVQPELLVQKAGNSIWIFLFLVFVSYSLLL